MVNLNDLHEFLSSLTFRNNPQLRPAGAEIGYTKEMIQEWIKCRDDPVYFIENYIHVVHPDRGVVLMKLHDYQKRMILGYHNNRRVLGLTARQMGKTTTAAAYFVHYIIFNTNKQVAILANKQATADEIMDRIRLAYESLPKWIQSGVKTWNRRSIVLENGCKCFSAATSSSGVRGKTINILYIDEIAFVENNLADAFFTAVYPTITASKESKVIMTSTPNGFNHFYKFWTEAEKGINGFTAIRAHWHEMPGRDQKWYDEQRQALGEMKAAQELDASFLGSSMQLLTASTLANLSYDLPIKEYDGQYKGLKIYEEVKPGHSYVCTVDVSRGRHLDSSAFFIYDVTQIPYKPVVSYNNNEIAPMMYASVIHKLIRNYNNAYTLIEINDVGAQVADILYSEFEYEEMFWTKAGDQVGKTGADPYPGIRTTKKTKRIGCANLKDLIEKRTLLVNDFTLLRELSTFVQSKAGSYEADEGFHDDAVMCQVLFAWLVAQPWFKDLTDSDIRKTMYDKLIEEMENDLAPFFFHSDGQGDPERDAMVEGFALLK